MSTERETPAPAIAFDATVSGAEAGTLLAVSATIAARPDELAALVESGRAPAALRPGATVGRFVILSALGEGSMGRVYLAFDPELDRRIALKLLRGDSDRARQLREAQALARVTHPHVVRVYDVGLQDGRVWIAMELIVGRTLGAWSSERSRSWREILEVTLDAGRGVLAAHEAGLVHRDLKPENMMVANDGRVVVMDFGLARAGSAGSDAEMRDDGASASIAVTASTPTFSLELTREGAVIGTPAYMAPEQLLGRPADERADLFSYCVVLWEALHGARPFEGETLRALARSIERGVPRAPLRGRAAPSWLRAALVRGLAFEPEARWPSMRALLESLAIASARRRRRRGLALVGLAAAVPLALAARARVDRERARVECETLGRAIEAQWNEAARDRLRRGTLATGVGFAESTYRRALPMIETWTESWSRVRTQQCVAARVERSQPERAHELIAGCLEDRRVRFAALLGAVSEPDARSLGDVLPALAGTQDPESCLRDVTRRRDATAGRSRDAEVLEVYRSLERARALGDAARFVQARELAREALATAERLASSSLGAEARLLLGQFINASGDAESAARELKRAFEDCVALGLDAPAADAAITLVEVVGVQLARREEGRWWGEIARGQVRRLGEADGLREATRLSVMSNLYRVTGDFESARAQLERGAEIELRELGEDHPRVVLSRDHLGVLYASQGMFEVALPYFEQASARFGEVFGDDHPKTITANENLSGVYMTLGRLDEAARSMRQTVAAIERAYGHEHPRLGESLGNLAVVLHHGNRAAEARREATRALRIQERARGADHPRVGYMRALLGEILLSEDRVEEAIAEYNAAIGIYERGLGDDSLELARVLDQLAFAELERGEPARAEQLLERLLAMGSYARLTPPERGDARYLLAKALVAGARPGARDRALALAGEALELFRDDGPTSAERMRACQRWIDSHAAP